jgi:hypothetical protein
LETGWGFDMKAEDKARSRVLRFLSHGAAKLADTAAREQVLLDAGERGTISIGRALLSSLVRDGELRMDRGKIMLAEYADEGLPENHRDIGAIVLDTGTGPDTVVVNWSESPLGQLMRRKSRSGEAFLSQVEFLAGERSRRLYARTDHAEAERQLGGERFVGTTRWWHRGPDRRSTCGANARGESDPRRRAGTVGHIDRRVLLPERHGGGGDGARLAGQVCEDRAEDRARRAKPPL